MYLTNKRLVFKSHKLNVQNHELSLQLSDIAKVEAYKTMGLINNGLVVTTRHNTTEKFVVDQRSEWLARLTAKNSFS